MQETPLTDRRFAYFLLGSARFRFRLIYALV